MIHPIQLSGRVEAVLVAHTFGSMISTPVKKIRVIRGHGVKDDSHAGVRLLDSRETALRSFTFHKGMEVANCREFSAVSVEELARIARGMKLAEIPHGCLGENLVVSGIPKFTQLPPGTLLFFCHAGEEPTAVLAVWGENGPCIAPGEILQAKFPNIPKLASLFPKAAIGKRGIVGIGYVSGEIWAGDEVVVKIPQQQLYRRKTK